MACTFVGVKGDFRKNEPHSSAQSTCNPQGEILLCTYHFTPYRVSSWKRWYVYEYVAQ